MATSQHPQGWEARCRGDARIRSHPCPNEPSWGYFNKNFTPNSQSSNEEPYDGIVTEAHHVPSRPSRDCSWSHHDEDDDANVYEDDDDEPTVEQLDAYIEHVYGSK